MKLVDKVAQAIRRGRMLEPGTKLAVACSGGADSVALVLLLTELKDKLALRLLIAHLNHQLRGAEADADEGFVRRLAERLELEFLVRREDVGVRAHKEKINLEQAGREARMDFFASLIQAGKAQAVALAHTLDDQAETVLARLLRGAGTRGLAGIYPVVEPVPGAGRGRLVRPLLERRRAELRDYLSERQQDWREDVSNRERSRLRNRIRMDLLPELARLAGPAATRHLARLADHARQEESFWAAYVEELFWNRVRRSGKEYEIPVKALLGAAPQAEGLPPRVAAEAQRAVARRLVRRALAAVRGDLKRITQSHVESVLNLAEEGHGGQRLDLPDARVERHFDTLVFGPEAPSAASSADAYRVEISGPGRVLLPGGRALEFTLVRTEDLEVKSGTGCHVLNAGRVPFPLVVRNWEPGDRYRPLGAARREKLKVLFQRRRIPRRARAGFPVVLCGGEIVWAKRFGPAAERAFRRENPLALVIWEKGGE